MYSLLLKKALPFALTFILGSLVGGLFNFFFGTGSYTPTPARAYSYSYGEGHCCRGRMRHRYLVAESKPLNITFKPDARLPRAFRVLKEDGLESMTVRVTFGADRKVQDAVPVGGWFYAVTFDAEKHTAAEQAAADSAAEVAAMQIQFEPEMVNGVPVTVTREVEIHFAAE